MMTLSVFFFFNDTATTEIYTLSLHDALPIYQTRTLRLFAYVARCEHAAPARRLHRARRLPRVPLLLFEVRDEHVGALAREGQGDGAADAGVSARDDRGDRKSVV